MKLRKTKLQYVASRVKQHSFISISSFRLSVSFVHLDRKYLAVAGIGAAVTAIGIGLYVHTRKEEKHGWFK
jgi:hypothetical protein